MAKSKKYQVVDESGAPINEPYESREKADSLASKGAGRKVVAVGGKDAEEE